VNQLSPALLARYSAPSPRYTSYPTVTHWGDPPPSSQWIEHLDAALQQSRLSLYVHIPFCQSLCTFCGCHMRVLRNPALSRPYIDTLLKEYSIYRDRLDRSHMPLSELHLGGGSPNFLPAEELDRLLDGLLSSAEVASTAQLATEADPRFTTRAQLDVLQRHGFNRISLGVQDMDPRVQDIVNRTLEPAQLTQIVEDCRERGFTSINFDLIYGLPLQTAGSLRQTMDFVDGLRPERIAFYPYAHVPWIKSSQRRYTEADLPEGEDKRALYLLGRERLAAAGYVEIGVDQFALPGDFLAQAAKQGVLHRNFMGYTPVTTHALIGLGVSAIGDAWTSFAQNEKSQQRYELRVQNDELPLQRGYVLNEEDQRLRSHILDLLTHYETRWQPDEVDAPWHAPINARLSSLEQDGLITRSGATVAVTTEGRALLRSVCAAFDQKLHPDAAG
jgi:oxygen-independent coproporphyrinogen III oxidase